MRGLSGSWAHLVERQAERVVAQHMALVDRCVRSLSIRMQKKRMPNGKWYRTVYVGPVAVCHIVGQGTHASSILHGKMSPYGKKI